MYTMKKTKLNNFDEYIPDEYLELERKRINITQQPPYTMVKITAIVSKTKQLICGVGFSKCRPGKNGDEHCSNRGHEIALGRAKKELFNKRDLILRTEELLPFSPPIPITHQIINDHFRHWVYNAVITSR